jgi:hypothetical protein
VSDERQEIPDRRDWLSQVRTASATLETLPADEFYDRAARRYHPVRHDIAGLIAVLATDESAFGTFVERHPQTAGWLPLDVAALTDMSLMEIIFRMQLNIPGERWVDGALVMPFRTGVLKAALDRLIAEFDEVVLKAK